MKFLLIVIAVMSLGIAPTYAASTKYICIKNTERSESYTLKACGQKKKITAGNELLILSKWSGKGALEIPIEAEWQDRTFFVAAPVLRVDPEDTGHVISINKKNSSYKIYQDNVVHCKRSHEIRCE